MWETLLEVFMEALLDSLKALPFLLLCFILLEFFEHRAGKKTIQRLESTKKAGPVLGAVTGVLPQCGISVMASNLYAGGAISIGTLIAVFIATSDEALVVMLSNPEFAPHILIVIGIKLILAIVFGYVADFIFKRMRTVSQVQDMQHEHTEHCHSGCGCSCNSRGAFVKNVLRHTLSIFLFIFGISLLLGFIIEAVGTETLRNILLTESVFQPLIAALVGLIPNCAASVLLAELYMENVLSFAALLSGLCAASGLGLLTLFRANRNMRVNFIVLGALYVISAVIGLIATIF